MKILVVTNLFPPYVLGGYEILCGQVCERLVQRGHRLTVLASTHGSEGQVEPGDSQNVKRLLSLYLPFDRPARIMRVRRWRVGRRNDRITADAIRREQPDVIFLWSQLRLTVGPARAAERSGTPAVYTFNDANILTYRPACFGPRPRALARYVRDRWLLPGITFRGLRMRHATCISRVMKQRLTEGRLPAPDLKVIYQGIPIEKFPLKPQPGEVHSTPRLLYVGQLHAYKGVHTLLDAARRIAAGRGRDALRVTIAGDGPEAYKRHLRERAAEAGCPVDFRGRVAHDELPQVYREHDIFVFPSTWQEPAGITHLEAMASGTPVVSTAHGGQGEFLEHERNALVFEKEDASGLADQIVRLIGDPDLRRALASNGRETVADRFTTEHYVDALEALLHEAAGR